MESKCSAPTLIGSGVAAITKELIRPDWQSNTDDVVPQLLKQKFMPWHLKMSSAPGTFECFHWCSPCKQSYKNCRSASTGMPEATSLSRCHSPSRLGLPLWKVWPLAIFPLGNTLDHLRSLFSMPPTGKWAESFPLETGTV